jgi:hypothetical protein
MTDTDYLDEKEMEYLNADQKKIYNKFKEKSAIKKYNRLCVLEYVCPTCGSDLNGNNVCYTCDSQFSIVGKEIPIAGGCGH